MYGYICATADKQESTPVIPNRTILDDSTDLVHSAHPWRSVPQPDNQIRQDPEEQRLQSEQGATERRVYVQDGL